MNIHIRPIISVVRGNDLYFPNGNELGNHFEPLWLASCGHVRSVHGRTPFQALLRAARLYRSQLAAIHAGPWQVIDDGLSREAANRIVKARSCGRSAWDGYEFKVTPSEFHAAGYFQIESRKLVSGGAA